MKYTGEKCFHCGLNFNESDDVVVCPDCGTPYHRSCYKEAGKCLNDQLHESGESWKSQKEQSEENGVKIKRVCPDCMHLNSTDANKCENCEREMKDYISTGEKDSREESDFSSAFGGIDPTKEYLGFNPDEDWGGAKLKEVAQFVDSNTFYYIPIFKRMKEIGSKLSFNFMCLFFPSFYFANRKMWFWGIAAAFMTVMLNIPEFLYLISYQGADFPIITNAIKLLNANEGLLISLSEICSAADWILRVAACLFANWFYFRHSVNKVNKVKAHYGGPVSPQRLKAMGGVNPANIIIMGLITAGIAAFMFFLIWGVMIMI